MIYDNIVKQCQKKKISVSALEKAAGLGNGTIGGWRTSSPTLEKLQAVADALGVKLNKLLEEKN